MSDLYIGKTVPRKDGEDKVTGFARYTDDVVQTGTLYALLVTSPYAHAQIVSIDTTDAISMEGVHTVICGQDWPVLTGAPLEDWPLLAIDVVRYAGEPVALVIADTENQALAAAKTVRIVYETLPVLQSPRNAAEETAPLLHPNLGSYRKIDDAYPVPGTNIANHTKIRKGNFDTAWSDCDITIHTDVAFPQSHHAAMETHCAIGEVFPDGRVEILTSTQAPYSLPEMVEQVFGYHRSRVRVETPLVGGGFGGKAPAYWELLAVAGSASTGGRRVHLRATREQDMHTMPGHIGLEGEVRLGAKADGRLIAAHITFWFDGGAYSNRGLIVTRAAATDCTGPYRIPNVWCDSYCMYTNHPPTTAYRGFGHPEATFLMERAMDVLANQLGIDPLELRRRNAILPGDTTPTQAVLTRGSIGDLPGCLDRLQEILGWPLTVPSLGHTSDTPPGSNNHAATGPSVDGPYVDGPHLDGPHLDGPHLGGPHLDGPHLDGPHLDGPPTGGKFPGDPGTSHTPGVDRTKERPGTSPSPEFELPLSASPSSEGQAKAVIRAKGICCIWKNSSSPPNASSGTIVKVERDGSVTVLSGAVEIGQGTKTALAQMVAEVFKMSINGVHVVLSVNTETQPEHWKTVASRTTLLAGNATVRAAKDAVSQLRHTASIVLGCNPEEVRIEKGVAFTARSTQQIDIGDLSHGYVFPDGRTVGQRVIGVGSYMIEDVVPLDPDTGRGVTGPEWTVGAQGVEIEYDPHDYTYRVVKAVSVIDCGRVIHPQLALGQIMGGMNMGLSLASREGYVYSSEAVILNPRFRTYPIHRFGDQPQYAVEFLETPHQDAPFGLRGIGEHGLIGMPAALANALSRATGRAINVMPMTHEVIWRIVNRRKSDGGGPDRDRA